MVHDSDIHPHPVMTDAGLDAAVSVMAVNHHGEPQQGYIAAERPLTIYLNKRELVTLMTLGTQPELLVLGWLRNQRMVADIAWIRSVRVDWDTNSVAVTTAATTKEDEAMLERQLGRHTVTTGCGQGTVFGNLMNELEDIRLLPQRLRQSTIYSLLESLKRHNTVYRRAGSVHGCALCAAGDVELYFEDVGRHNAVDAIAGSMWLTRSDGRDKLLFTTGRLTSEMVIKVGQMGISVLISRNGITQMGLELARKLGVTLISRAKGRRFLVYNGAEHIDFDAAPTAGSSARKTGELREH